MWSNVFRYCRWSLRWRRHTVQLAMCFCWQRWNRWNLMDGLAIYVHRYAHQLNVVLLNHTCQAIPGKPGTCMSFCSHFIFSKRFSRKTDLYIASHKTSPLFFTASSSSAPPTFKVSLSPGWEPAGTNICAVKQWTAADLCDTVKTLTTAVFFFYLSSHATKYKRNEIVNPKVNSGTKVKA